MFAADSLKNYDELGRKAKCNAILTILYFVDLNPMLKSKQTVPGRLSGEAGLRPEPSK
jgi:hypothetical protein